jgi:hypothetical protein
MTKAHRKVEHAILDKIDRRKTITESTTMIIELCSRAHLMVVEIEAYFGQCGIPLWWVDEDITVLSIFCLLLL